MSTITSFKKEGTNYIIALDDKPTPCIFNFENGVMTSYTGKEVKNYPSYLRHVKADELTVYLLNLIKDYMNGNSFVKGQMERYNMFYTNPDLIEYIDTLPNECPKGYIKWIRENNRKISRHSLQDYKDYLRFQSLPTECKELVDFIKKSNRLNYYFDNIIHSNNITAPILKAICKIFKVSMKTFSWDFSEDFYDFCNELYIILGSGEETILNSIDTNRTFEYNTKLIHTVRDKLREKAIINQENRIRDITKLSNDTFTIIVPNCLEDFTIEGKQQNNCVGYYYHDYIAQGRDFIYFIRNTANPDKSLYTCRFDVYQNETAEKRAVNNTSILDNNALDFIREIDKYIRDNELVKN
jgi:hypothetical protein